MYQPQTPLIQTSPRFRSRRLAEIELGQLILLGDAGEPSANAVLGIRGDALSRRGEVIEGLFRLTAHSVVFERHALDESLTQLQIEYELQADLAGAVSRHCLPGDLVVRIPGAHTLLVVAGPWDGRPGMLDLASAVARPFAQDPPHTHSIALAWRLVDRQDRSRVLFQRSAAERTASERPEPAPFKRLRGEDSD